MNNMLASAGSAGLASALLAFLAIPLGGVTIEHFLENVVMGWLPQKAKIYAPYVLAYLGQAVASMASGTAPLTALCGGHGLIATLVAGAIAQAVHGTAIGATSAEEQAKRLSPANAVPPALAPKLPLLLLGLLLLAGTARADIALSGNFGAGGAVYDIAPGGSVEATGVMAATYGLNLAWTGTITSVVEVPSPLTVTGQPIVDIAENVTTTYNYFIISAGGSYEPHVNDTGGFIGGYVEIGTQIPDSPDNIMVGTIGNAFTGQSNPFGIVAAVNFPIGQPWHTWK